jgi:hypothetical protein
VRAVESRAGGQLRVRHVLAHTTTQDGRFLPAHTARCVLDAETQALLATESALDEFKEQDGLVLPRSRRALAARDGLCRSVLIELLNLEVERADPETAPPGDG